MFFMTPLYLFITPYLLYHYRPFQEFIYGTAMFILLYVMLLEDFMLRKSIIKEIQIMESQEVNSISPDISFGQ
jgi:hypothetical protein